MGAVNELIGKHCIPQHFEELLLLTFKNSFNLLLKLTQTNNTLESIDPEYLDKFSELLRLFVSLHLRRFENKPEFPMLDFLSLLFRYTFQQPNVDAYFSCLDVWSIFLDHLTAKLGCDDQAAFLAR